MQMYFSRKIIREGAACALFCLSSFRLISYSENVDTQ